MEEVVSREGRATRASVVIAVLLVAAAALWFTRSTGDPALDPAVPSATDSPAQGATALAPSAGGARTHRTTDEAHAEANHSLGSIGVEGTGKLDRTVIPGTTSSDAGLAALEGDGDIQPAAPPVPAPLHRSPREAAGETDGSEALSELEVRARKQPRDASWAPDAEAQIKAAFVDRDYGVLRELRCGSTLCNFVLEHEADNSEAFVRDAVSGVPWQAPVSVRHSKSGHALFVVMAREGHALDED